MGNPFPKGVQNIWDEWNLRGAVLVSLSFQVILILSGTSRKRTGNPVVILMIWSAYLLADWVAAFAVGLISNGQGDECDKSRVNDDIAAFWAPFLLLHLGGPDTISAFSLEDNELWLRHLLGLIIQLLAVIYVFIQSLPNDFWIPTVLMLLAGFIKYAERTRALYLACLGNFKESMLPEPDPGPNYAQLMEEYSSKEAAQVPVEIEIVKEPEKFSRAFAMIEEETLTVKEISDDIEVVQDAFRFYKVFKGLIVDLMFSFQERNDSRKFFFQRNPKDAFRVMEVELNFMYDAIYTKMDVVHRKIGYSFRFICSILIVVSFWYFASHHKGQIQIHRFDIAVTYTLLIGATALDLIAMIKLIFSDWTIVSLQNFPKVRSVFCSVRERLSFDRRCRWSQSTSQHSFINYCLKERFKWFDYLVDFIGVKEFLDEIQYKRSKPFEDNLKVLIFEELKAKAKSAKDSKIAKDIYAARGDLVLDQSHCYDSLILKSVSEEVEYDESLLLWHIATELCYFKSPEVDGPDVKDENREICLLLSEYMMYLLVMRPTLMSAVAGIGQVRFRDSCEEAKKFFRRGRSNVELLLSPFAGIVNIFSWNRRSESMVKRKKACEELLAVNTVVAPSDVKGDRSKSLLFDACILAKGLNKLRADQRWVIISKVWVEMLAYAASHCRANGHAEQLSKGGELVTFVWLLMAHFGLGEQFRIEAGHARAKLIVGK